jgi:uncharacterized protein DUF6804
MNRSDQPFAIIRVFNAALLLWALARHPIGYYTILSFVTCAVCGYAVYLAVQWKQLGWAFIFGATAILFNPLLSFRMTRQTWAYVDVIVAIFLVVSVFLFREKFVNETGA